MADEYSCPQAPPPVAVDGGWLFDPMRVERLNCALSACAADRNYLRDAGQYTSTQAAVIAGVSAIVTGLISAYAADRVARHLSLVP